MYATPRNVWVVFTTLVGYSHRVTEYPADFVRRYRDAGYWTGQTHSALLERTAADHGDRVAVIDSRRRLTYAELLAGARGLAHGLVAAGLDTGDRVVVQMPNVSEYLEVIFGLFDAGLVPVFALASHSAADVDDLLTRSQARAYITVDAFGATRFDENAAAIASAHPDTTVIVAVLGSGDEPRVGVSLDSLRTGTATSTGRAPGPEALAFLQLSGGTTGSPKLIPRTHDDYLYSVRESADICGLHPDSVFGVVLPVSHNFTMSSPGVLGAIHAGSAIVMVDSPDPHAVFGAVAAHRITHLSAVPPLVAAWIDSPARGEHDISSLQVLQVGGAKLSRSIAEKVPGAFGVTLQQVFGMAEGLVNYTRLDDDPTTIVCTQGRPISPDDEIRIVDADGNEVLDGTPGSLRTRGPYTIRGYWGGQAADSFTPDGFYCTGDIVVRDDRGYLQVVGRDKDQINRAGEKIAPEEVENLLLTHPAVRDASVVGVADDRLGERIVAYLIAAESGRTPMPDEFGMRAYLREQGLTPFKVPDRILVVDEFPTTAVGKISKNAQRDDQGAPPPAGTAEAGGDAAERVRGDLAGKLGISPAALSGSMALADTGIDSLQLMALLDAWRASGAHGLDFEALVTAATLDDLVEQVVAAKAYDAD